jgi:hypothetical protein
LMSWLISDQAWNAIEVMLAVFNQTTPNSSISIQELELWSWSPEELMDRKEWPLRSSLVLVAGRASFLCKATRRWRAKCGKRRHKRFEWYG